MPASPFQSQPAAPSYLLQILPAPPPSLMQPHTLHPTAGCLPQGAKEESSRLRAELQRKDDMMGLLQSQLSELTNVDLGAMLKQIDTLQAKAPPPRAKVSLAAIAAMTGGGGGGGGGAAAPVTFDGHAAA